MPRFGTLGVIASMQPYHEMDDGRWAEPIIGHERSKTTYAFKSILDAGARLAFGSDWSVAPPTPLEGIYGAVTRETLDGKHPGGWIPEQKITVEDALRAYTSGAAYASFEENIKGTLEREQARGLRAHRPRSHADPSGGDPRRPHHDDRRGRARGVRAPRLSALSSERVQAGSR